MSGKVFLQFLVLALISSIPAFSQPTVTVGLQTWMSTNLNVDHFTNGDPIPEVRTDAEWKMASDNHTSAWCNYNNDQASGSTYGKLYNWYAVIDSRGLAPKGWHVPTDDEWDTLIGHLAGDITQVNKLVISGDFKTYTTEGVGTLLKSTFGWENDGNGNNNSGIAGLPGGYRFSGDTFFGMGESGHWWSSTEDESDRAWRRYLTCNKSSVGRTSNNKGHGFSVRCVRD